MAGRSLADVRRVRAAGRMRLRLYVAGDAPNSRLARTRLSEALSSIDPQSYELEIVDCLETPLNPLDDGIVVTPTLMRLGPGPAQTLVGSLSDRAVLLNLLRGGRRE